MKHQKRQAMPKNWPIPRKGTAFVVEGNSKSLPILLVLRDILKIAKTRREVKQAIHVRALLLNNKPIVDEKLKMQLLDILTIIPEKKNYQLIFSENGKFSLEEVKNSKQKCSKVIGKKILKNKNIQLNLYDGRNYLSNLNCKVNDSATINLESNKIERILPLKEKSKVLIIGGKHTGKRGEIIELILDKKMVRIKTKESEFNVLIKQLMVIE